MRETIHSLTGEIQPGTPTEAPAPPVIVPLASPSHAQVWGALAIAQGLFEPPKRTKEATIEGMSRGGREYSYTYKYAPLEEIERVVRKPLADNELYRQQYLVSRSGQWFVRTVIGHSSGEWIASDYPVYASKEGAQGFASGVTYARRYGLSLALGLCPEDDDDAQVAADSALVTASTEHRGGRQSKKIDPPVAKPGLGEAAAREAYRRLKQASEADYPNLEALTAVYNPISGQWSEHYAGDVSVVSDFAGPQYLEAITRRIATRYQMFAGESQ